MFGFGKRKPNAASPEQAPTGAQEQPAGLCSRLKRLTGIALTKLDGVAKGGILFAIAERLRIPIRFIGVGETIEDLRPFVPRELADALFEQ